MAHDVDKFLSHRGSDSSGVNRLGNWKKEGSIDLWLHKERVPQPLWKHSFHRIEARENKETKRISKEVWSFDFVCHESESVLKRQFRYEDDDITREVPPEVCPFCKAIHWVRTQVKKGKLDWKAPIFRFEGSDKEKNVVIHAGGWWNAYKEVERDTEEYDELSEAGIYIKNAWRENGIAKLNYVFTVLDNANIDEGLKVSTEPGLLGDKVKAVIRKAMEELGDEEGNPFVEPYCFRWKFNEKAQINEKYDALKLGRVSLTEKIESIISGKAPSIDQVTRKGDVDKLRALFEKHALIEMPLDDFFENAKNEEGGDAEEEEEKPKRRSTRSSERSEEEEEKPARRKKVEEEEEKPARRKKVEEEPPKKEKMIDCDDCGAPMKATDRKCKKCGAEYEIDEEEEAPKAEEPKPKKKPEREPGEDEDEDEEDEEPMPKKSAKKDAKKSARKGSDNPDDDDDPF